MKKYFSLILLTLLPIVANAYDAKIDGIYYNFSGDNATVTYYSTSGNSYSGAVVIPSTVTYNEKTYSVTSIGQGAFASCDKLTSVIIGKGVKDIEGNPFSGCSALTSIKVESGNTTYDSRNNCNAIIKKATKTLIAGCKNTIIPNGVTSIGEYSFCWGSSPTEITIPNSVTSIGNGAFYYCRNLTSVTIPNSVTNIGDDAFYGCTNLTTVTLHCKQIGSWFRGIDSIKNLILGNKVKFIGEYAFYDCDGLTDITIPNSVTDIGEGAFGHCRNLTSVTIPNSVTSIGDYAFSSCEGLISIIIPNSVTSIGEGAFYGCSGLRSVTIPNSVTSIGTAFTYCTNLTSVTLESNAIVSATRDWDTSMKSIFGNQVTEYIIGNDVKSIGDFAFCACYGLTSVTIGSGVTSIGNWAFSGCSGLTSVTIPGSVTSIGNGAFRGCSGLRSVTIPNSVTSIGNWAFEDCSSLTSITIPSSVKSIGYDALEGCYFRYNAFVNHSSLSAEANNYWGAILFGEEKDDGILIDDGVVVKCRPWATSVTIPNSVTAIGVSAFYYCRNLTSVTIPESVTSIGDNAFYHCDSLTSVTIPNSVTSIGHDAFYRCSSLTSVTIPNSVTSIGNYAFENCSGLTEVYCYAEIVPNTDSNAFYNSNIESATLHVPAESIEQYKAMNPWSKFGSIVPLTDEDAIEDVKASMGVTETARYDINGRKQTTPQRGINIIRFSDGTTRKVIVKQ